MQHCLNLNNCLHFSFFQPPPPLNLSYFKGGIELDTLNEAVMSLYNFEQTFELNTTKERPYSRSEQTFSSRFISSCFNNGATCSSLVSLQGLDVTFTKNIKEIKDIHVPISSFCSFSVNIWLKSLWKNLTAEVWAGYLLL